MLACILARPQVESRCIPNSKCDPSVTKSTRAPSPTREIRHQAWGMLVDSANAQDRAACRWTRRPPLRAPSPPPQRQLPSCEARRSVEVVPRLPGVAVPPQHLAFWRPRPSEECEGLQQSGHVVQATRGLHWRADSEAASAGSESAERANRYQAPELTELWGASSEASVQGSTRAGWASAQRSARPLTMLGYGLCERQARGATAHRGTCPMHSAAPPAHPLDPLTP